MLRFFSTIEVDGPPTNLTELKLSVHIAGGLDCVSF